MILKGQVKAIIFLAPLVFFLSAGSALATTHCVTQYGGEEECYETDEIILDKKVLNKPEARFEENLADSSPTGYHFALGDRVIYRIKVTNISNHEFDKVTITDTLPTSYLAFDTAQDGARLEYADGKIVSVSYDFYHFKPGQDEEKQIELIVKSVPADENLDCEVFNIADGWADHHYQDTARICVGGRGKVLGVTTLPKTGSFWQLYVTAFSLLTAFIGLLLIRLNRKP